MFCFVFFLLDCLSGDSTSGLQSWTKLHHCFSWVFSLQVADCRSAQPPYCMSQLLTITVFPIHMSCWFQFSGEPWLIQPGDSHFQASSLSMNSSKLPFKASYIILVPTNFTLIRSWKCFSKCARSEKPDFWDWFTLQPQYSKKLRKNIYFQDIQFFCLLRLEVMISKILTY